MKVKNRLLNFDNMVIYQDNDYFLFSLDSVLLANFVTLKLTDKKIIDLCSGNGPVPMLMSFRTKARIFGVEIQKYICDMAVDSIEENNLANQIEMINDDVNNMKSRFSAESFDAVTCNPPYFKYKDSSLTNKNNGKTIARHEVLIKLDEIVSMASYLLKNGGTFALVHTPDRLIEIIELMKKNNIEPKKMQLVYPKKDKNANMLLIEGTKNGRMGLKILNPLIVHNDDDTYTCAVKKMFEKSIE